MWACGVDWDTPLTENAKHKFLKWYNGLEVLNELRIPRHMGFGDRNFWSFHVFCEAKQGEFVFLIRLGTFVGNRDKEISVFSKADQWSYVPGPSNPVDLPSCVCSPLKFSESDWWSGPDRLKDPEDKWPKLEIKPDEILVLSERRKGINLNVGLGVTAAIDEVKWYSHAGIQALTVIMREEFWNIGARRTIRSVVKQCIWYKRFSAKPLTTAPIQLPLDTVIGMHSHSKLPV
ncbi:integrase_H2C2 domain-containing protein [Trichonephila clavipes]|nr:integrase_H2C2 domain-containing protein [Trichonephila clavipes]